MKRKNLLMLLLSVMLSFSCISVAFASTPDEYIRFYDNSNTRINSNGTFDFLIRSLLKSDTFTADSDEITISIAGKVWDSNNSTFLTTSDTFTVTLRTSAGVKVGKSFTVNCDGKTVSKSFSVTEGKKYYFEISANGNYSGTAKYVKGDGRVTPIQ